MELVEAMKEEREKISEALKTIGYEITSSLTVNEYCGDVHIGLTIRKPEE